MFKSFDDSFKLGDIASVVSLILDLPIPFSNMGNIHPFFAQTDNLRAVH